MVFGDPVLWADTMRWWAPAGAVLALWPVSRGVMMMARRYLASQDEPFVAPAFPTLFGAVALWLFLWFSIVMGIVLPFTRRTDWASLVISNIASWAWTLAAVACWATAIGYARSRLLASATAMAWFIAVSFAVLATS